MKIKVPTFIAILMIGYPTVSIDFDFVKSYADGMAIMKTTIMTDVVITRKMNLMP